MSEKKVVVPDDVTLYILMRTDLASLNPGKAMAQASHAYGALKSVIRKYPEVQKSYLHWMETTEQEFGTTIVLGGNREEIDDVLFLAEGSRDIVAGWVHDPTYPVLDGVVTHLLPMDTCAFVFGSRTKCLLALDSLELHA